MATSPKDTPHLPLLAARGSECTPGAMVTAHFTVGHVGLHQLHTKQFCMQQTKAYVAETSCNQLLIDSATSLLTIYSPILNNVAMSLYDII